MTDTGCLANSQTIDRAAILQIVTETKMGLSTAWREQAQG